MLPITLIRIAPCLPKPITSCYRAISMVKSKKSGKDVSKKEKWRMTDSNACDVALLTFLFELGDGSSSARRRLRYERKFEIAINFKSSSNQTIGASKNGLINNLNCAVIK